MVNLYSTIYKSAMDIVFGYPVRYAHVCMQIQYNI